MYKIRIVFISLLFLAGSCVPATKFLVTNIGYEPLEIEESLIYALPQTSLKIGIGYEKRVFLPGPYCDYSLKLLGINGVNRTRSEVYKINKTSVKKIVEADGDHFYSVNIIEGSIDNDAINSLVHSGYILLDKLYAEEEIVQSGGEVYSIDGIPYKDVTMEPNIELREETIYKTILTDTSFVRVPIISEQLEPKTLEKKAKEAAKLILEIRSDRYYISAGLLDPYPQDFDLKTALATLDKLEMDYLSLFIGKSYTQRYYREFFITPVESVDPQQFVLGSFTSENGYSSENISADLIEVLIVPGGTTKSMRNLLPQLPEEEVYNKLYYRIPEMTNVSVLQGNDVLHKERIAVYQLGAMVNVKQ